MATCKRCGKEIKFIKTKKGKWMPVDIEIVIITPVQKVGKPYLTEEGQMIYGLPTAPNCVYKGFSDVKAYKCHFASCLYGDRFKKKMDEKLQKDND